MLFFAYKGWYLTLRASLQFVLNNFLHTSNKATCSFMFLVESQFIHTVRKEEEVGSFWMVFTFSPDIFCSEIFVLPRI